MSQDRNTIYSVCKGEGVRKLVRNDDEVGKLVTKMEQEIVVKITGRAFVDDYKRLLFENHRLTHRVAQLEKNQGWIRVGEKPLEAGTFFVLLKNGDIRKDWTFIDGGRYYWWNSGDNVTHYMPVSTLPEVQE